MADVFFKLTAEEKDAVNALLKVVDAQKKVEGGYRSIKKSADDTDKSAQAMGKSFESTGKAIMDGIIPGISGIATAAGAATVAIGLINEQLAKGPKLVAGYAAETQKLAQSLAQSGKISFLPEIEKQIQSLSKNSKSMSESQVRGVANALGPDAKKLDAKGLTEAMQYAVKSGDARLDPATAGKMYAQLRGLNPSASAAQIERSSGQLLGLKNEGLDEQEMLRFKRDQAAGRTFEYSMSKALAGRKSGENEKTLDRIHEQAAQEIKPSDLEDKYEVRPENKAKLEKLKKDDLDLAEQKLKLEERGGHGKRHEREMHEISQKEQRNALERRKLEEDKVVVKDPEQQRLRRLNSIPMEQREDAILKDSSLADPKLRDKIGNVSAAMEDLRKNPAIDLLQKTQNDFNNMKPADKKKLNEVQGLQKAIQVRKDMDNGINGTAPTEQISREATLERIGNAFGGGTPGDAVKGFGRFANASADYLKWDASLLPGGGGRNSDEPQEVHVVEDSTKVSRTVPARNGGD